MRTALTILLLLCAGCGANKKGVPFGWNVYTFQHDGHSFIIATNADGHFIHHPDCPCGKDQP